MATPAVDLEQVHRITLDEYHQLIESGVFDEDLRVELIDGLLLEMGVKSPAHENAITWLAHWLITSVDSRYLAVRVGSPLTLTDLRSEPEPDFSVVRRGTPEPFHPATAVLVIEVSFSSLRRDLVTKPVLYARAGVPEYWVVDIDGRRVVCHRTPGANGYRDVTEIPADGRLTATSVQLPELDVAELFAAAGV